MVWIGSFTCGFPSCSTPPPAFEDAIRGDYPVSVAGSLNPGGATPVRQRLGPTHSVHHMKNYREETVR